LEIVGVTEDFHFASLHQEVGPLFFVYQPTWTHKVVAKIAPRQVQQTLGRLEAFYQNFNPGYQLNYTFLDQEYQAQYAAEQRVAVLSKYFAGLAVVISCLGLFGLAAFTAERRQKEIGIRKILGSSTLDLVKLLNAEFTRVVILAMVIAIPLSYILAKSWLDGFAYGIELRWWLFVLAGGLALLVSWLTVGLQTIKAALANPVDSLRSE
jgi:ABC-type antimicrobial peptide transport system permease subunit